MAYYLPEQFKEEYKAMRRENWRKLRIVSFVAGVVMFVLATGAQDARFGLLIGISTFLSGLWLSYYLAGMQAAETLRKRLKR
jgi:hypothetical protein